MNNTRNLQTGLTWSLALLSALLTSASASTLTWTGGGDGTSFAQLANWSGTPTGGTIDIANLLDTYFVDSSAVIAGVGGDLRFRAGGGLQLNGGQLTTLTQGTFGLGFLETPDALGTLSISQADLTTQFLAELNVTLGAGAQLTLAGSGNPVNESTINFADVSAQLHFTGESTSNVVNEHLAKLSVFGSPAVSGVNINIVGDGLLGAIVTPILPGPASLRLIVDRDSGRLLLTNTTGHAIEFFQYDILSSAGGLDESGWTSIAGHYDQPSHGGDGTVDPDDAWFRFTAIGSRTDLAEGTTGQASLAHNQTIDLGFGWIPSPFEDLTAVLSLVDDTYLQVDVEYSGTLINAPIAIGDLNADGVIDAGDWPLLRAHLFANVASLKLVDAHAAGDLDSNGQVDEVDFILFAEAFDAAQGAGAFAALLTQVPEPTSLGACVVLLVVGLALRCRSAQADD